MTLTSLSEPQPPGLGLLPELKGICGLYRASLLAKVSESEVSLTEALVFSHGLLAAPVGMSLSKQSFVSVV